MQLILFLLIAVLAYQNNANLNLTKNQVIIVSLIAYYFLFMQKENFALSASGPTALNGYTGQGAPGVGPFITDKTQLSSNTSYLVGTIDPSKQVVTSKTPINGGASCVPFPTTVYRAASAIPAECRIGSSTGTIISNGHTQAGMLSALDDSFYSFTTATPVIGSSL